MGPTVTTPPVEPLASKDGVSYPFPGGQQVFITSGRGPREPPVTGASSWHPGLDMVVTGDPRILAVQGGKVVHAGHVSGWGNTIAIETPSGHVEQFGHLDEIHVAPGEVIPPGQTIGVMGNTGISSGAHLDFIVYAPGAPIMDGNYRETTIDPLNYLTTVTSMEQLPGGVEGVGNYVDPFTNVPHNIDAHDQYSVDYAGYGGRTRTGVSYSTPESTYNNSNPQRTARASRHRSSYQFPNDPQRNYGYEVLEADGEYRRTLAEVGNRLGIPAQWIADLIALEAGPNHSPSITNSIGCVGFQFCPGGGLADVAQEMQVSEQEAFHHLANMSRSQQLRWFEYYVSRYSNGGEAISTIEDLYALWNAGPRALTMNPADRDRLNDGNGTVAQHYTKLGEHVGRRYALSSDRYLEGEGDVHNVAVPGCPECVRMMNSFGTIHPHHEPR